MTKETTHPTVAGLVAEARASVGDANFLSKGQCVDWLLDCLTAAVRPPVEEVVLEALADFSQRNMSKAGDFLAALDKIHLALQVDAAFDDAAVLS